MSKSLDYTAGVNAHTSGMFRHENPWDGSKAGASRKAFYDWDQGWVDTSKSVSGTIKTPVNAEATMTFTHGTMTITGTPIFVLASIQDNQNRDSYISTTMNAELEKVIGHNLPKVKLYNSVFSAARVARIPLLSTRVCRKLTDLLQQWDCTAEEVTLIEAPEEGSQLKVVYSRQGSLTGCVYNVEFSDFI